MKFDYVRDGVRTSLSVRPVVVTLLLAYLGSEEKAKQHIIELAKKTPKGKSASQYVTDSLIVELSDPKKVGDIQRQGTLI